MDALYRSILRPILFQFEPDAVHDFFIMIGRIAGNFKITRAMFSVFYNYRGRDISKTVDGIKYRTPVILSAGFDPDGELVQILPSLSFGGEEIGSVTALASEGSPRPHFKRLVRNKSIVVYKGLRNRGADALIRRLGKVRLSRPGKSDFPLVIGVSIARTNAKEASTDVEAGIRDYVESFKKLNEAGVGDYYAINISCPNAYTGETFSDPKLLAEFLPRLRAVPCEKPVYIKMPICIPWEQFSDILDIAEKNNIHGVIIGNVHKDYKTLDYPEDAPEKFRGGISGAPCRALSTELIKKTREKWGRRFTIIGSGGIMSPDDAMEKFNAGADLIELISGMIFEGPGLIKSVCERYASELGG